MEEHLIAGSRGAAGEFKRFLEGVGQHGLPVNFLRAVSGKYHLLYTEATSYVSRTFDTLYLEAGMMRMLPHQISPTGMVGEASVILTIYHEATHAYFDIMKNAPAVSALVRKGEEYYRGAPFQGAPGMRVEKPETVVQEAAAMYMARRAATWWSTFEALMRVGTAAVANDRAAAAFESELVLIQQKYDDDFKSLDFGYEPRGGEQLYVEKPIFAGLKQFLDDELLEQKIPDKYYQVLYFQEVTREVRRCLGLLDLAAPLR